MGSEMVRHVVLLKVMIVSAALLASPSAQANGDCRIAVLGDSLAAGYGLPLEQAFPAQLEDALQGAGYACVVLNAGVSGDTSAGGLARVDWMLGDEPSHVIVELGGNDGLRALPPDEMAANIDSILERLGDAGIEVLIAGMLAPPNLGRAYGDEFKAVFPQLAEEHDVPLYPFFLEGVAADPSLNQQDGIHPNADGIEVIVERMLPAIGSWLEETGVARTQGGS
jgi:acyl-CoA thioesterase-1